MIQRMPDSRRVRLVALILAAAVAIFLIVFLAYRLLAPHSNLRVSPEDAVCASAYDAAREAGNHWLAYHTVGDLFCWQDAHVADYDKESFRQVSESQAFDKYGFFEGALRTHTVAEGTFETYETHIRTPRTFAGSEGMECDGTPELSHFRKGSEIYSLDSNSYLEGVDSASFKTLDSECGQHYAADRNTVFLNGTKLEDMDPQTFRIVDVIPRTSQYMTRDTDTAYFGGDRVEGADPGTLHRVSDSDRVFADKNHVYNAVSDYVFPGVDPSSFRIVTYPIDVPMGDGRKGIDLLISGDTVYQIAFEQKDALLEGLSASEMDIANGLVFYDTDTAWRVVGIGPRCAPALIRADVSKIATYKPSCNGEEW